MPHVVVVRLALSPEVWGMANAIAKASRRKTREVVEEWARTGVAERVQKAAEGMRIAKGPM